MVGFPYCEVCGQKIKGNEYAVELYAGKTRRQGLLRNFFGKFLDGFTASLGTAHAKCLHKEKEEWGEGELVRKTLLDAANKQLVDKNEVEA